MRKHRHLATALLWIGALVSCAILAVVFEKNLRHKQMTSGLPYRQSTARRIADDWRPFGGTWEVTGSTIRDDSDERGSKLITGPSGWSDYSIEGNIMLRGTSGYASDVGFLLRSSEEEEGVYAYRGYYAILRRTKDGVASFSMGRVRQGPGMLTQSRLPSGLETHAWYHVMFLAVGCRLIASVQLMNAPAERTVLEATDPDCFTHGHAGLTSSHAGGEWRDVVIQPADVQSLSAMRALASTPQPDAPPSRGISNVRVVANDGVPDVFKQAPIPIGSALLKSLIAPQSVTITGQVTLTFPEIFVQDSSGGIPLRLANDTPLKIGDEISAIGEVSANGLSPIMKNAAVKTLWEGTPISASSVTAARLATGAYDGEYIEVQGVVLGQHPVSSGLLALDFSTDSQTYEALLPRGRGVDLPRRIEPQSVVRLRGVATRDPRFLNNGAAFGVLVRTASDVQVITGPPWWRLRNLLILAFFLAAMIVCAGFLYGRIERAKLLAVVQERERLAYEMHDTLAQSVAGIGFQLEAIRGTIPADQHVLQKQLALAQQLVRHSHTEARASIDMLRPQQLQQYGLLAGLKDFAQTLIANNSIAITAETVGSPIQIPIGTADALFRIGREAIANAIRHAAPTRIHLRVEFSGKRVALLVLDDGVGFNSEAPGRTLGIMSMRKRSESIDANLAIASQPGKGTEVTVDAPLHQRSFLGSWRDIFRWKHAL